MVDHLTTFAANMATLVGYISVLALAITACSLVIGGCCWALIQAGTAFGKSI